MTKELLPTEHQMLLMLNDFLIATSTLAVAQHEGEKRVIVPQLVLSSFALEVALKCLLKVRGIDFSRGSGHNLQSLFRLLPETDQRRILEIHREQAATYGRTAEEADAYFHEALDLGQLDFVRVRYVYEKAGGHETRNLGPLVLAVYSYLFEVRSDWKAHQIDFGLTH
jgi:hypothetical protein